LILKKKRQKVKQKSTQERLFTFEGKIKSRKKVRQNGFFSFQLKRKDGAVFRIFFEPKKSNFFK